jgi:TolB-like protein
MCQKTKLLGYSRFLTVLALVLVAAWAIARTSIAGATIRLGVMEFATAGSGRDLEGMGAGLQSMITTDLANVSSFVLVERARLRDVTAELKLGQSRFVDATTAAKFGKVLGATHLLTGSVTMAGSNMRLDVRLVEVATGRVLLGESNEGKADVFFELEKALVRKLVDVVSVQVTPKERGALAKIQTADIEAFRKYGMGLKLFDDKKYELALKALREAADRDLEFGLARTTLSEYERIVAGLRQQADAIEQDRDLEAQRQRSREMTEQQKLFAKLLEVASRKGDGARDARLTALYILARQYDGRSEHADEEDRFARERTADMLYQRYLAESLSLFPRFPALINNFDDQGWWKFRMPEIATFDSDMTRLVGELKDYGVQTKHKDDEERARHYHKQRSLELARRENAEHLHLDVRAEADLDDRLDGLLAKLDPEYLRRHPDTVFERVNLRRTILDLDTATKLIVGSRENDSEPKWLRELADEAEVNARIKGLVDGRSKLVREMTSLWLARQGRANQRMLDNLDRDLRAGFGPDGNLTESGARDLTDFRRFQGRNGVFGDVLVGGHVVWNVEGQPWTGPRNDPRSADEIRYFEVDPSRYVGEHFTLLIVDGVPRRDVQAKFRLAFDDLPADFRPERDSRSARRPTAQDKTSRPTVTFVFGVRDINREGPRDKESNGRTIAPMRARGLRIDTDRAELVEVTRPSYPDGKRYQVNVASKSLGACNVARAASRSTVDVAIRVDGARIKATVGDQTCDLSMDKPATGFYGFLIERPGYVTIRPTAFGGGQ